MVAIYGGINPKGLVLRETFSVKNSTRPKIITTVVPLINDSDSWTTPTLSGSSTISLDFENSSISNPLNGNLSIALPTVIDPVSPADDNAGDGNETVLLQFTSSTYLPSIEHDYSSSSSKHSTIQSLLTFSTLSAEFNGVDAQPDSDERMTPESLPHPLPHRWSRRVYSSTPVSVESVTAVRHSKHRFKKLSNLRQR